jgi:large subunit ribosomal protein L6
MSRLAKKPIALPSGVTVNVANASVTVRGPKGELSWTLPAGISVETTPQGLMVHRSDDSADGRRLQGTSWSVLSKMVRGVHEGYVKELELSGTGYKVQMQGGRVVFTLGFSHPVVFEVPAGVKVETPDATSIRVSGCNLQQVGDVAARIRRICPAEPYKGKGIRYKGEQIRRKAGKTMA